VDSIVLRLVSNDGRGSGKPELFSFGRAVGKLGLSLTQTSSRRYSRQSFQAAYRRLRAEGSGLPIPRRSPPADLLDLAMDALFFREVGMSSDPAYYPPGWRQRWAYSRSPWLSGPQGALP